LHENFVESMKEKKSNDFYTITQIESTLPKDYKKNNLPSHILYKEDSRAIYIANRGHDSVAVFEREN